MALPPRPIRVYDPVQQLAIIDDDVLERFQVDTIELGRGFALDDKHWADWTLPDGTPCQMPAWALPERQEKQWVLRSQSGRVLARMPEGAIYFEQCYWPYLEEDDFDRLPEALGENMWCAVQSPPGPLAAGPDGQRVLAEGARQLRAKTDRAILGLFGGNLLEVGQFLYRNDNFLMLLAGNPKRAHEFLDRLVEIHLAEPGAIPAGGRPAHRRHRLWRRFGNAERAANLARHVPGVLQAAARPDVAAGEGTGRREGDAPLLRRHPAALARPDRGRLGRGKSRADHVAPAWTRPS